MPRPRALDLAAIHRLGRTAEHEAGDDVGAAGDRGQVHVGLDGAVDVVEALRQQRRAGRERSCAARADRCVSTGAKPPSRSASMILRAGAEDGDALLLRPSSTARRRRGGTGEPSYSTSVAPAASPLDQPVPHHPAAGGEVEQPVAAAEVAYAADAPSGAAAACRRRRARCISARPSCPRNTGCRADD